MKTKRLFILFVLIVALLLCAFAFYLFQTPSFHFTPFPLKENSEYINNPYCGFYHINAFIPGDSFHQSSSTSSTSKAALFARQISDGKSSDSNPSLTLLEINLKNYQDKSIDQTALDELETIFSVYRDTNQKLIVRFLYDWDGKALQTEPANLSQIKAHINALAPVINQYEDIIFLLQGNFAGDYGEMHNTRFGSEENNRELMETLANRISENIYLSVRTPQQRRSIIKDFSPIPFDNSSIAKRLGLFNDGMFGSNSDLGTYDDTTIDMQKGFSEKGTREEELDYQNILCQYVPNGGEAVLPNPLNDFENAVKDLSRMHVSYLNADYDEKVLSKWKNYPITDTSPLNENHLFTNQTGYDFIQSHLGYRFVLNSSTFVEETNTLNIKIKNTGFASCYRKLDFEIIFREKSEHDINVLIAFDSRKLFAGEEKELNVSVPASLSTGKTYQLYFKITDSLTKEPIYFANRDTASKKAIHSNPSSYKNELLFAKLKRIR